MKLIAITQRVESITQYEETRDATDQRWWKFLWACGITPIILPNNLDQVKVIMQTLPIEGILLTGGNDTPDRNAVEIWLLQKAISEGLPLFGICHGMQVIQRYFGIPLNQIANHVSSAQEITIDGRRHTVNSYHDYGTSIEHPEFNTFAYADDGIVKGIQHATYPLTGIMWHPERLSPFAERDIQLMKHFFYEAII